MSLESVLSRAARWFVSSGIQTPDGGVARYYRSDLRQNHPVSTEITGYSVSALLRLGRADAALAAARFLTRKAWNGVMPFELEPGPSGGFTYFFDCGIIVRGLLAAWRASREQEFLDVAAAVGRLMITDFAARDGDYHPILQLPGRQPVAHDPTRWSQAPGCYQLKSGLAWRELFDATGEAEFREAYDCLLAHALRGYGSFLPGHSDPLKVVDRLHAFLYFLEGMQPRGAEDACAAALCEGIQRVASIAGSMAGTFERSDVYAQLLRIRVYADWAGVVPLDRASAAREAAILAGFQAASADSRIDGGFYFGRKDESWLPYVNPVSTAFGTQALALWEQHSSGAAPADWRLLI